MITQHPSLIKDKDRANWEEILDGKLDEVEQLGAGDAYIYADYPHPKKQVKELFKEVKKQSYFQGYKDAVEEMEKMMVDEDVPMVNELIKRFKLEKK